MQQESYRAGAGSSPIVYIVGRSPDPLLEEHAFGYVSIHQTSLHLLWQYLKSEAVSQLPRASSVIARCIETLKDWTRPLLERLYQEHLPIRASIAVPDKLSASKDADAQDNVAQFLMRKKRYATIGLKRRLSDDTLSLEQREHALQTLGIITGRKFHLEPDEVKIEHARKWMDSNIGETGG